MNAAQERRLDAQAQQMAFEMGFAPEPESRGAYQRPNETPRPHGAPVGPMAKQTQFDFIKRLIAERELDASLEKRVSAARELAMAGYLLRSSASKLIDALKAAPYKGKADVAQSRVLEDGIYVIPSRGLTDQIFKVYVAVHGSGQLCVKRLVVEPGANTGSFEYMGLASKHLPREARKMSLEEAKEFGAIYGFCVRCGRTLTDEESIAAGIGPVCAGKM